MLKRLATTAILINLLLSLWTAPATAQSNDEPPPACPAPEARQFDFWIGDWDINNRHRNPQTPDDPTWFDTGAATNRVYAILDGCAIVEHWMGRLIFATIHGFSVRAYDPAKEQWVQYAIDNQTPVFERAQGSFEDGTATLTTQADAALFRETWSPRSADKVLWKRETSTDDGASWTVVAQVELTQLP